MKIYKVEYIRLNAVIFFDTEFTMTIHIKRLIFIHIKDLLTNLITLFIFSLKLSLFLEMKM